MTLTLNESVYDFKCFLSKTNDIEIHLNKNGNLVQRYPIPDNLSPKEYFDLCITILKQHLFYDGFTVYRI